MHGAAGFQTKNTWLKVIRKGNFLTWPLVNVKNVNKYFPESEETQKGHMRGQRQGVRSTKKRIKTQDIQQCDKGGGYESRSKNEETSAAPADAEEEPAEKQAKQHDIFVTTYDMRETMYTDQTGKFPYISSRGNKYQMVLHELDSNSSWVEPMKNRTEGEMILARGRAC